MTTSEILAEINDLLLNVTIEERIDIASNILLNSDAFGLSFWDRSDIDLTLESMRITDDIGDVVLTNYEYSQVAVMCREMYRKTDDPEIETCITMVLTKREQ
jgi:hypothetical protein